MTVTQAEALLSAYTGAGYVFLTRLNLVRARLLQGGNWPDTLRLIEIAVTEDASTGFDVVVLPAAYVTILAAAALPEDVTVPCGLLPLGVNNVFDWFNRNSLGYGAVTLALQELAPDGTGTKRYQVPTSGASDTSTYTYLCLVKMAYVALTAGADEVTPNNIAALKAGLQALLAEDADNRKLSRDLWAEAEMLLAQQSENETGPAAAGVVEIADNFDIACIGGGL